MEYLTDDIDFGNVIPLSEINYDSTLATDPNKIDDLKRFVITHHNRYTPNSDSRFCMHITEDYMCMVDAAIKSGNLMGLMILWKGIRIYARHDPEYEDNVYLAIEYGNPKMIKYVLSGYMNYDKRYPVDALSIDKLKELSLCNPDPVISKFIMDLSSCGCTLIMEYLCQCLKNINIS